MPAKPVKITQFEAENIKRIRAVTVTPGTNGLTIVGGKNGQGKTSVLDAIIWALGGDRYRPSQPQRDGSTLPPKIKLTLSNGIIVERSGKNSDLKVTDPSGRKAGQQLLNSFVEQFALDMPKFMQAAPRDKAVTLLRVIGLEARVGELDRKEQELYNQRRAIGQISDQKKKYADELPSYPDAPDEIVSASELIQRQQAILARNGENQRKRQRRDELKRQKAAQEQTVQSLKRQLQEAEKRYQSIAADYETAQKDALDLLDESTAELEKSIRDIDATNTKVRTNQAKAHAQEEAKQYSDQYEGLTAQIEDVRKQKRDLLNGANLPLPGLSVENGELTYMGKPWDCMSGSDQLRVSAAIVRALKPQCGFILMDKLEQMDLDSLREFGAWMAEQGLQGIATRVSTGDECSIIIEDGYAKSADETPALAAPVRQTWKAGTF